MRRVPTRWRIAIITRSRIFCGRNRGDGEMTVLISALQPKGEGNLRTKLPSHFQIPSHAKANEGAVIQGENYRFTVLTPWMLRIEYSQDGIFEDRATQMVWNRDFPVPAYTTRDTADVLEIDTEGFHLHYRKGEMTRHSLYIDVKGSFSNYFARWYFGDPPRDLGGTRRTLDKVDGPAPLERGLCSFCGHSWLDDSLSLILCEDGFVQPREHRQIDCYYFGYGRDYERCIADFYRLTRPPALIPRFALGNWWSRYYAYTAQDYLQLMERFAKEKVPLSVAIIDMGWHLEDIPEEYGRGWTGYTWNRELFEDPHTFIQQLKAQDLAVALNIHPADGVRAFEDAYPEMAREMGVDPQSGYPVRFDCSSQRFMNAYFEHLHHPQEAMGVDFFWLDWQQGTTCDMPGLDPLWVLNHLHAHDLLRKNARPFLLSRYAGPGSHRYGCGFSGDTFITWKSLQFQPYFTATASNIGFGWWSHDIGGHMKGYRNEELAVRWTQLGAFSPVMRMHSNDSPFTGKEPWLYRDAARACICEALRLRHRLIPYLYTMNEQNVSRLRPLIRPVYYTHPNEKIAYTMLNEYWFGTELLVAPVTTPAIPKYGMAMTDVWLPEGLWTDFFTGDVYRGNVRLAMARALDRLPVLARQGAIVPLDGGEPRNAPDNPKALDIYVFPGADGSFSLYEDDGVSMDYLNGHSARTEMRFAWSDTVCTFACQGAKGDCSLLPQVRDIRVIFRGFARPGRCDVSMDGRPCACASHYEADTASYIVQVGRMDPKTPFAIRLEGDGLAWKNTGYARRIQAFLYYAEIEYDLKEMLLDIVTKSRDKADVLVQINALKPNEDAGQQLNLWSLGYPHILTEDVDKEMTEILAEILYVGA